MSYLFGSKVSDTNVRLRLFVLVFFGIISFASVLFWKQSLLMSTNYVDFPQSQHLKLSTYDLDK